MNYEILMAVLVLLILIVEVAKLIMLKRGKLRFNLDMLLNFSPKILCGCKGKKEKKKFTPPPTVKPKVEALGVEAGQVCNRDGCKGIIESYRETEEGVKGCTCHLGHPPCSHCVDDPHYCPECGWEARNEQ